LEGVGADPTKTMPFSKSISQFNNQNQIQNNIDNLNQTNVHGNQTNIHGNQNNIQHIQHITINNFGQENKSCITPSILDQHLRKLNGNGITGMISHVHFNGDFPENQNIRCKSLKRRTVELFQNNEWTLKSQPTMIDELINMYRRMLHERSMEPEYKNTITDEAMYEAIRNNIASFSKILTRDAYNRAVRDVSALIDNNAKKS
jgi:hypothetical protein